MSSDITGILDDWPYDGDDNVRIIEADDGRSVLQVRQPLGLEQYEMDGRPDGVRPGGFETFLEELEHRLAEFESSHGSEEGFEISETDASDLQNEGIIFYYRYLLLFQLNDFERVIRDTGHNLRLCDLLERFAPKEEAEAVLQFKPYIYRMHSVSQAMSLVQRHENSEARSILESAIDVIEAMEEIDTPAFQFERVRSVNYLRSAIEQIEESPDDPLAQLQSELDEAIELEDYERAADLRDRMRDLP